LDGEGAITRALVIARSEATKQSSSFRVRGSGLLRFARNDGEADASPLHARHPPLPFNNVAPPVITLAIANELQL
jgi:hypothetical protein